MRAQGFIAEGGEWKRPSSPIFAQMSEPIPSDSAWLVVVDIKTGLAGYFNQFANSVETRRPDASEDRIEVFPVGWERMHDKESGKIYYRNLNTCKRQWEQPSNDWSGWEAIVDVNSGRVYYKNAVLSQWTRPAAPPKNGNLPPGWELSVDQNSGRPFYVNRALKMTQWDPPTSTSQSQPPPPYDDRAIKRKPNCPPPAVGIPPGWQKATDPETRRSYFINAITGEKRFVVSAEINESMVTGETSTDVDEPKVEEVEGDEPQVEEVKVGDGDPDDVKEVVLPQGWKEIVDPGTQKRMYINSSLGKWSFERPAATEVASPQGWQSMTDSSGKSVWVNLSTGKVAQDLEELQARLAEEAAIIALERRRKQEALEEAEKREIMELSATALSAYFVKADYFAGCLFCGHGYRTTVDTSIGVTVYEHVATGIRVWSEAVDLRGAAPAEPAAVFYHYTNKEAMLLLTKRTKPASDLLLGLPEVISGFGAGIFVSRKDPDILATRQAVTKYKCWLRQRSFRDKVETDAVAPSAAVNSLVDFCVPILVPASLVKRISPIEMSNFTSPPGDALDAWIVALPEGTENAVIQAALGANLERRQQRALFVEEKHGKQHPETLVAWFEVAWNHLMFGNDRLADQTVDGLLPGLGEVLDIQMKDDECSEPPVLRDLAELLMNMGRYTDAEPLLRNFLARHKQKEGPTHQDTLRASLSLGLVLKQLGQLAESETIHRETLKVLREELGPNHPDALIAANNYSEVLKESCKFEEAEKLGRDTLKLIQEHLGWHHTDALVAMNNLAMLLVTRGKTDEAEKLCKDVFEMTLTNLGHDHPLTFVTMDNFAKILEDAGRYEELDLLYRTQSSSDSLEVEEMQKLSPRIDAPVSPHAFAAGMAEAVWAS